MVDTLLEADAAAGLGAGISDVAVALRSLRRRQLDLWRRLDPDDWLFPSRCHEWSVHDVVRHVRDACRLHVEGLRARSSPFNPDRPFDARETPKRWLERTINQTPAETMAELSDLCVDEAAALDARIAQGGADPVEGPYGPIHWTTLTTHVVWDGWLHERDVTQALDISHPSSAVEDRVVALYGLLIASMPAALIGSAFDVTVGLTAEDGSRYAAEVRPGGVVLGPAAAADELDLHGELGPVVDALAGRGPELGAVLHGEPSAREPLTWLRPILAPEA